MAANKVSMQVRLNYIFDLKILRCCFSQVLIYITLRINNGSNALRPDQIGSMGQTIQIKLLEIHIFLSGMVSPSTESCQRYVLPPKLCFLPTTNELRQLVELRRGFQRTQHPVWPARAIRRESVGRPGHAEPLLINSSRLLSIDRDVAVFIIRLRFGDPDCLMPTVHSRNRIRMNRKCQVLVYSHIAPPDSQGVGIVRAVRL